MSRVLLPVDSLDEVWPAMPRDARVGALLHSASVGGDLVPTLTRLEALAAEGRFRLTALFGPQHGFESTTQDNMVEWESFRHPRLDVPVFSLYGEHRQPTPAMLDEIDVLFVDLVDVGSRYYTFIWTLFLCMEACQERGIPVIVADRPNPIDGVTVEGEPQRDDHLSFVGLHPLPHRHGKTIGELAELFRAERFPDTVLTVLPLAHWDRNSYHDETGLAWVMPSPNMPSLDTALVYPGLCLFEGTTLSEGRGTTRPFELFGAPGIDSEDLASALRALGLPGCHFRPAPFQPAFQKHAGRPCGGAQLHVTDRRSFLPFHTGVAILSLIRGRYPENFDWTLPPYEYETKKLPIEILLGRPVGEVFA